MPVLQFVPEVLKQQVNKWSGRPKTCLAGTEGRHRYSSSSITTSALERIGWPAPRPGRFSFGKQAVSIVLEAGQASVPFWTGMKNSSHRDSIPGTPSP